MRLANRGIAPREDERLAGVAYHPHRQDCKPGKEDLTQADLAFARQASRALRHVVRHQHTLEEVAAREQALESLPSMAKYRARQLARSMEESLPDGTASKPSSRL